jgi:hypothetical protein
MPNADQGGTGDHATVEMTTTPIVRVTQRPERAQQ